MNTHHKIEDIKVLLIEDDIDVRESYTQSINLAGIPVLALASVEQARSHIYKGAPIVIVSDVRLPGMHGDDWLHEVNQIDDALPFILITGHGDITMAVKMIRSGAFDFIEKPCTPERLLTTIKRAIEVRAMRLELMNLRAQLENRQGIEAVLIGQSPQLEKIRNLILSLADTDANIIIHGETGTGKELVARCLHDLSQRKQQHFVAINCGGMSETLAESELFGHEAGAFTGANKLRLGKFEYANGGTLFLDEIETMPISIQIKLLRALQENTIERLGANKSIKVNCRVVAASKEDLLALSDEKKFRSDLYYRLGVAFIELPALRDRREDILLLFEHFALLAASRYKKELPMLTHAQQTELLSYPWPGNVRELRNVADRFVLGIASDKLITQTTGQVSNMGFAAQVDYFERLVLTEALRNHQHNISETAKALALPRQTLYDKIKKHQINIKE